MSAAALTISVLALVGVLLLLFGYAAILRIVRELQEAVSGGPTSQRKQISRFAGDALSIVLVTDRGCLACIDRTAEFFDLVRTQPTEGGLSFFLATAGQSDAPGFMPAQISYIGDPEALGQLGVGIFPTGLVYNRSGVEVARALLADSRSLERLVAWAVEQSEIGSDQPLGTRGSL